jgi:hypothetical protein
MVSWCRIMHNLLEITYSIRRSNDNHLKSRMIDSVKTFNVARRVLLSLLDPETHQTGPPEADTSQTLQTCPSGQIYPLGSVGSVPLSRKKPETLRVSGSICPPHDWPPSGISSSPRVGVRKHERRSDPLNDWTPMTLDYWMRKGSTWDTKNTNENRTIANRTKYATLVSKGAAILRERMIV